MLAPIWVILRQRAAHLISPKPCSMAKRVPNGESWVRIGTNTVELIPATILGPFPMRMKMARMGIILSRNVFMVVLVEDLSRYCCLNFRAIHT